MKLNRKVNISSDIPTASMPDIIFMLLIFLWLLQYYGNIQV